MRGISEKELKDRQDVARRIKDYVRSTLIDELISECKELPDQQWKTIDEFMAEPIEGWCFLIHRKFNNRTMGNYSLGRFWIDGEISKEEHITHVMPITTP